MTTPVLSVFYDPNGVLDAAQHNYEQCGIKVASIALAEGLEGKDIYKIAERLAALLLEQL